LRLSAALPRADIGLILDFVPNHMGVHYADNAGGWTMLEWGPKSPHAASFDIDWDTCQSGRGGGVLLPILGRSVRRGAGKRRDRRFATTHEKAAFSAWYFEHRMPIGPSRYGENLEGGRTADAAGRSLAAAAA
jgi:(1->4)-alpha-D-glucan 1-alpha-D-glucosylmutase